MNNKFELAFKNTETSMMTVNLKKSSLNAIAAETLLNSISIFANRQMVPGDIHLDKASGL